MLYLQHGYTEGESGWGAQGHAGLIMDNLIAEGKTRPFIIVMENGGIPGPLGGRGARRGEAPAGAPRAGAPAPGRGRGGLGSVGGMGTEFERVLIEDVIPFIDANFRTMAGLSMGGMQTRQITLAHLDAFSHIGLFSGGTISPADVNNTPGFKEKVKVLFISCGSKERPAGIQANHQALDKIGIKNTVYVSPNTAHEWQTWRRSLHQFAPLLFTEDSSTPAALAVTMSPHASLSGQSGKRYILPRILLQYCPVGCNVAGNLSWRFGMAVSEGCFCGNHGCKDKDRG